MESPLAAPWRVTSPFGMRQLPGQPRRMHNGVDLVPASGPALGAPVLNAAAGTVVGAVWRVSDAHTGINVTTDQLGNWVRIKAPAGHVVLYAHLKAGSVAVRAGQTVREGEKLGEVGSTGASTAPHLHYEIRKPCGGAMDAALYLGNERELGDIEAISFELARLGASSDPAYWERAMYGEAPAQPAHLAALIGRLLRGR